MQNMQNIIGYKNRSKKYKILIIFLIIFFGAAFYWYFISNDTKPVITYITKPLKKSNLTITVFATGYLEPTQSVSIGTEVSGTISKVFVNFNDKVKKGEILAQINKIKYESAMNEALANLSVQQATLRSVVAKLTQVKDLFLRDKKLKLKTNGGLPSQNTWDMDKANYLVARANVVAAKAQVSQAKQRVISAKYNLSKTTIYSPSDGTVLVRNIDPGQTVAASFQTPILFKIANNLKKMQLQVNIDEGDIAKVKKGQDATFSVDAYPQKIFKAHINLVRVNSQMINGVVTYIAQLDVNNSKLLLRPGMSADANIVTKVLKNKFIVPRSALLYIPIKSNPKKVFGFAKEPTIHIDAKPHIWILKNKKLIKIYVKILGNKGALSAISSKKLKKNNLIVIMQKRKS